MVLMVTGLVAGCGEKTPKCSSDDAKNLIVDICKKDYRERHDTR